MTTLRRLLLLAAAAILPNCGPQHEKWLWVTVQNSGAVSADIQSKTENVAAMSVWEDQVDVSVSPNESVKFGFRFNNVKHLDVSIYRSSDHSQIFNESWDRNELERLNELVAITVSP
jgi:hypothetical protein